MPQMMTVLLLVVENSGLSLVRSLPLSWFVARWTRLTGVLLALIRRRRTNTSQVQITPMMKEIF